MQNELFENVIVFPEPKFEARFDNLVGLDAVKEQLTKEARLILNPSLLDDWSEKHYKKATKILNHFRNRGSLFIFAGDVGTGKTTLAETFGNVIAREEKVPVTLYRLSLKTRGNGTVGDMTLLLSRAFDEIVKVGKQAVSSKDKKPRAATILVIDEGDSLAQSRELAHMHHEDRVGVNALIRGVDAISSDNLPVIVVLCTNRLNAIDPAVRRRAVAVYEFTRPNDTQRKFLLNEALSDSGIKEDELNQLVKKTGFAKGRSYGYTYSDIMQRLLPAILLDAFPDKPLDFKKAIVIAGEIKPTPPFKDGK